MRMENTVKLNRVRPYVIKLQIVPFSLRDVAATWFDSLLVGPVNTWEELVEAFMSKIFPLALTVERRGEIIVFKQGEDESLYTAWERFKRLLKRCPMHGIDLTTQMDIFYHAMNYTSKGIIDASCCGSFKRRSAEEARQVIEDLAKCNYKTPSKSSRSSNRMRGNGLIGLDRTTAIEAKLDVVMNKLRSNEGRMHTAHEVGAVREGRRNSAEGYEEEEPYQVTETKYMNEQRSYHFKPNPNLPTHHSPTLRNHENFSFGGKAQQGTRYEQNHHQAYTQPGFQQQQHQQQQNRNNRGEYQGQRRTQTFEDQVLQFMTKNKRILNMHEKKFAELESFQANTIVFQTNINQCYIEKLGDSSRATGPILAKPIQKHISQ